MNISASMSIAIAEAKIAPEQEPDLDSQLRAAMKATHDHWLITNEEERFKAAVGAVIVISDQATRVRIAQEIRILGSVSAAITGVPVDFSALLDDNFEPIGLLRMWKELGV